ncbi:putative heparan sulfate n-deacetylase/n-sulfotransferase [Fasciola gigantica]|uniref:[heparan sulfate]-glucosamine N-sulfotransferase n=1 Tax=Fasciola gigantica TaxID=46835 RepID=A0A504XXL5_FASGI|nr:putative heparan sulfate n-deacetylase/n-sulfotransferase [Fasciola gigantica]
MSFLMARKIRSYFSLRPLRRLRPTKLFIFGIVIFMLVYFVLSVFLRYTGCCNLECVRATLLQYPYVCRLPIIKHTVKSHQIHTTKATQEAHKVHETSQHRAPSSGSFVLVVSAGVPNSDIVHLLDHLFLSYRIIIADHRGYIPSLLDLLRLSNVEDHSPAVQLFIFEDFALYLRLPIDLRSSVDQYCITNDVGVIAFLNEGRAFSTEPDSLTKVGTLPVFLHRLRNSPWGIFIARNTTALHITRQGRLQPGPLESVDCCRATLVPASGSEHLFVPLMFTRTVDKPFGKTDLGTSPVYHTVEKNAKESLTVYQSLIIEDPGLHDGIRRIMFSTSPNGLWINKMLLFDAMIHLSRGRIHASPPVNIPFNKAYQDLSLSFSLTNPASADLVRWLLIDVDDVFLRGSGVTFTKQDATALHATQSHWRHYVQGFRFNLGFCGQFFERANSMDRPGYETILKYRNDFWWFDHLWNHLQPHKLNFSTLMDLMHRNKHFAEVHDIPVSSDYAVAPHHSGVYPIVPDLYEAWRRVWNLSCTSTVHYPHLLTPRPHLGFRYSDVQVLPRQTCAIYSRFIRLEDFPGGEARLRELVFGGSLFYTVLLNPVSIFMTHMTNYKGDRLALYLFDALFRFVRDWTNLKLVSAPPKHLAEVYAHRFASLGAQDLPVYSDPCQDRHDLAVWPIDWSCGPEALPGLLILGPQKSGSTALVHFLRLNPSLLANRYQFGTTFEELQFFSSDQIYARGLHWYFTQWTDSTSSLSVLDTNPGQDRVRFEKSATYFTSPKAPERIHALVPRVPLIVLLRDPVERAYSWYQHTLAHGDLAPRLISFENLMHFGRNITRSLLIRNTSSADLRRLGVDPADATSMEMALAAIRHLYNRCVQPGYYAQHLVGWLSLFSASQVYHSFLILMGF